MRDILLKGLCRRGLYPLSSPTIMQAYKQVYNVTKSSLSLWHSRLGHPSFSIVSQIVDKNGLPVISDSTHLLFVMPVSCHTRFLCQNRVLIVCMTQDQMFHTYGQKGSQKTKCHSIKYNYYRNIVFID
jgi:hypothetical protein